MKAMSLGGAVKTNMDKAGRLAAGVFGLATQEEVANLRHTIQTLEDTVASLETLDKILRQLGYLPAFRYEKYRTEFESPERQGGKITFDETPIGQFLELEGPGDWIDSTARKLDFSPSDYVLSSYGKLYLDYCAQRGVQPGNMVFASPG